MKKYVFQLETSETTFYNITEQVQKATSESGVKNSVAIVFCPHTTAAITINENADIEVINDLILGLKDVFPNRSDYKHWGGNSDAHIKSLTVGSNVIVNIEDGKIDLGDWQAIYFCEFDPPRNRKFYVTIL